MSLRRTPPLRLAFALAGAATACSLTTAQAQVADTTTASRYFPLAVGNEWHTTGQYWYYGDATATDVSVRTAVVQQRADGRFEVEVIRVEQRTGTPPDTTARSAVWYFHAPSGEVLDSEGTSVAGCPLDAAFGTVVECRSSHSTYKEYDFEINTGSWALRMRRGFAAGIGQVYFRHLVGSQKGNQYDHWELRYARVGGQEYGAPLFPVAGGGRPVDAVAALAVAPNPARGEVTLRVTLEAPAPVRVEVFDVLGRRVRARDEGVRARGQHHARLDLRGLAPGRYLVRLTAGREVHVAALTIAR